MPADSGTPRGRRGLSKGRMEGFSDGVFGFAITLLVVDIALHPPGTPLQQALHAWPAYLAYVTSFLTIGGAWLLHTALTDQLAARHRVQPHLSRRLFWFGKAFYMRTIKVFVTGKILGK